MRRPLALLLIVALSTAARAERPPTVVEERDAFRLADPLLAIDLVAAEPEVVSPVAIAWDELGRLYVAEMTDYPTAPTGGRIRRLEDRDGDGRYEYATLFADRLPYPNGVLPWNGGVIVTAAPELLFLLDTDGDGRSDVRRVILTGFGEGNQQLRVNSPTWGRDNWVYLANGRSGGAIRRPGDPVDRAVAITRNDLRVRPATGEFEPVAGFSQFGLPRDDWGDRFPSWNTVPIRHVVLENRPRGGPGVADILDSSDGGRIYSLAPTQTRFNGETVSFFNATCGPTINRGQLLDPDYRGDAFICEPLTSVVHRRKLTPVGPTFAARRVESGREFLASTHSWFRPVNLTSGPDGALYVVDFCRAWVEHPAFVPEALRNSVDFREGHERGRIWRIAPKDSKRDITIPLPGKTDNAGLVAMLADPNGWTRDTAQRLLIERHDPSTIALLQVLAKTSPSPLGRVHALWTLDGLGRLDAETIHAALRSDDPHVREQAVVLAGRSPAVSASVLAATADDDYARVRLQGAIALAAIDTDTARDALARIAARDADSPWTVSVILGGVAANPSRFFNAISAHPPAWLVDPTPVQAGFLAQLTRMIGARNVESEIRAVLDQATASKNEAAAFAMIEGLATALARVPKPVVTWVGPGSAGVERILSAASAASLDSKRPGWVRVRAIDVGIATQPAEARKRIARLLEPTEPAELQAAAARGLAKIADPALLMSLFENWERYAIGTRRILMGSITASVPTANLLLDAVAKGQVSVTEIDPATGESLRRLGDASLQNRLAKVLLASPNVDRRAVIDRYQSSITLGSNAARGRLLFVKNCQTCHAYKGEGAKVGPDLISVAGRPANDLLVAILDPSREAAADGLGVVVATTRGLTLTGLLAEETPATIRLRRAEGIEEIIPREDVEAIRPTGRSLMPDGLEQLLTAQDLADLITFLRNPDPVR